MKTSTQCPKKVLLLLCSCCLFSLWGQKLISSDTVYVSDLMVTSLLFEDEIKLIKLGDDFFLTSEVDSLNREVLFLKPKRALYVPASPDISFKKTNLLVKTIADEYYHFHVFYGEDASKCTYFAPQRPMEKPAESYSLAKQNDTTLNKDTLLYGELAHVALRRPPVTHDVASIGNSILFSCQEVKIFDEHDLMLVKFHIVNRSKTNFPAAITFDISEKKDIHAPPELYLAPLFTYPRVDTVVSKGQQTIVFVFRKVAFADNRVLRATAGASDKHKPLRLYLHRKLFPKLFATQYNE